MLGINTLLKNLMGSTASEGASATAGSAEMAAANTLNEGTNTANTISSMSLSNSASKDSFAMGLQQLMNSIRKACKDMITASV